MRGLQDRESPVVAILMDFVVVVGRVASGKVSQSVIVVLQTRLRLVVTAVVVLRVILVVVLKPPEERLVEDRVLRDVARLASVQREPDILPPALVVELPSSDEGQPFCPLRVSAGLGETPA